MTPRPAFTPGPREIRAWNVPRHTDSGQPFAVVEWSDGSTTTGDPKNGHMRALLARAAREHNECAWCHAPDYWLVRAFGRWLCKRCHRMQP